MPSVGSIIDISRFAGPVATERYESEREAGPVGTPCSSVNVLLCRGAARAHHLERVVGSRPPKRSEVAAACSGAITHKRLKADPRRTRTVWLSAPVPLSHDETSRGHRDALKRRNTSPVSDSLTASKPRCVFPRKYRSASVHIRIGEVNHAPRLVHATSGSVYSEKDASKTR